MDAKNTIIAVVGIVLLIGLIATISGAVNDIPDSEIILKGGANVTVSHASSKMIVGFVPLILGAFIIYGLYKANY